MARRFAAVSALVLTALLPGPARAAVQQVAIDGVSFIPAQVSILPGDAVEWENRTAVIHTVTERRCLTTNVCPFDEEMSPDEIFRRPFPDSGIFLYQCRIHGFSASVSVQEPPGTLPDLAIADISAEPSGAVGLPNPLATRLEVEVANEGTAAAPASLLRVEYRYRGAWRLIDVIETPPIPVASSTRLAALWDTSHRVGDFRVRASADPGGTLVELREANNIREADVALLTPGGVLPGLDLLDPLG